MNKRPGTSGTSDVRFEVRLTADEAMAFDFMARLKTKSKSELARFLIGQEYKRLSRRETPGLPAVESWGGE